MRLKLVIGASLLAALIGAGASITIVYLTFFSLKAISAPGLIAGASFLLPVIAIVLASVFVYRHTARRRKLQAMLTAIVSIVLTLCIFLVAAIFSSRWTPKPPVGPTGPTIAS
jgi:chromate transport protein ChrA